LSYAVFQHEVSLASAATVGSVTLYFHVFVVQIKHILSSETIPLFSFAQLTLALGIYAQRLHHLVFRSQLAVCTSPLPILLVSCEVQLKLQRHPWRTPALTNHAHR